MSANDLITILTATYNRANFIEGSIESVLKQKYTQFEYLIIDDGSTDNTKKIIETYNDNRIKYYFQRNSGQVSALNFGLSKAKGKFISFLDSDDEYACDHLLHLYETLNSNNGYDFVLGKFNLIETDPKINPVVRDFYNPGKVISVADIECITGVLFGLKSAFIDVGCFRQVKSADTDLFVRLQEAGYKWTKAKYPTYNYFFGRTPNSQALVDMKDESE